MLADVSAPVLTVAASECRRCLLCVLMFAAFGTGLRGNIDVAPTRGCRLPASMVPSGAQGHAAGGHSRQRRQGVAMPALLDCAADDSVMLPTCCRRAGGAGVDHCKP